MPARDLNYERGARNRRKQLLTVIGGITAMLFLLGVLIPISVDWITYSRAHKAYEEANCSGAIPSYQKLLSRSSPFNFVYPRDKAARALEACEKFQSLLETQEQDPASALLGFLEFVQSYPESSLSDEAKKSIHSLFSTKSASLATPTVCNQASLLQNKGWVPAPSDADVWAPFYWACAQTFAEVLQPDSSVEWERKLMTDYPEHPLAQQIAQNLLDSPNGYVCQTADIFRTSRAIRDVFSDFIPQLYLACGHYFESQNLSVAYRFFHDFLSYFPGHPMTSTAVEGILNNPESCSHIADYKGASKRPDASFLPDLYFTCGALLSSSGETGKAVEMYLALWTEYPNHALAGQAIGDLLQHPNDALCGNINVLRLNPILNKNFPDFVPNMYLSCANYVMSERDLYTAYILNLDFLTYFPDHPDRPQAIEGILTNIESCKHISDFSGTMNRDAAPFLPDLYFSCGMMMSEAGDKQQSFEMYLQLLTRYPDYSGVEQAKTALIENPASCEHLDQVQESLQDTFPDLLPAVYYQCAQRARDAGDFETAIHQYDQILSEYPRSSLVADARIAKGWTHYEWGQTLFEQGNFTAAMEHYQTAQRVTNNNEVHNAAKDGYDQALWGLALDQSGEGKELLETVYQQACDGKSTNSPAIGLARTEIKQALMCPIETSYQMKLPSDLVTRDLAHFHYVIQIENGKNTIERCEYTYLWCDGPSCPTTYTLIRQTKWVKVTIRSARTGGVVSRRTFTTPPPSCPQTVSHSLTETEGYLTGKWPGEDQIIAWLRNWLR
jgi:TolA-binding protein